MHSDLIEFIDKKDLTAIRSALRQAFIRSKYKGEFLKTRRIESPTFKKDGTLGKKIAVNYKCECCFSLIKIDQVNVDHIEAVGSFKDIREFYDFFMRIFCSFDNLQVLCKPCHKRKTRFDRMIF